LAQFIADLCLFSFVEIWHFGLTFLILCGILWQMSRIYPYTPLARKEVHTAHNYQDKMTLTILVSNVLMPNRAYGKLIALVEKEQPDLLLTLETDSAWENALSVLEAHFPYTIKIPADNLYGMHFYSRIALKQKEVRHLIESSIPSIYATAALPDGQTLHLYGLHPAPPSPTENPTSTDRDGELLLVGREAKKTHEPVIVFGDLNDVAWSRSTILFRKISGLLDPRIGRGVFNTFNVKYPLFRWPLDHLFHSSHFTLISIKRLESIGSDHFPIYIKLAYNSGETKNGDSLKVDADDVEQANEKIAEAKDNN
jgi:endonuclease/exonuclease/phosphatase (EEP) superfamily protein YafD